MSGAFPISNAKFQTMGIKSIQKTILSKSDSGKKLARQIDGQRFAFTAKIITAKRSDVYGELMAFIVKQRSGKENFTIIPPEIEDARGTASVTPHGTASAGATSITLEPRSLFFCLKPIFTTGIERNEPSLIPDEELPTKHSQLYISFIYSSGVKFLKNEIFVINFFSLIILS